MASGGGRVAKDVHYLQKHIDAHTNGQAEVELVDDNLQYVLLNVFPNDGLYKGAKLKFKIEFDPSCYPDMVPAVKCLDRVYHPNIDPLMLEEDETTDSSNVCVSLLDEWEPSMGLDHIVMAILFLLYNPNPEDALSPYIDGDINEEDLAENTRKALRGEKVEGESWPCLLIDYSDNCGDNVKPNDDGSVNDNKQLSSSAETLSSVEEVSEKTTASVTENLSTAPLPESGPAKDSDDQNLMVAASASTSTSHDVSKLSVCNTEIFSHQKSVRTEVITQTLKDCLVIPLDAADCDRKSSACECYSNSMGLGRLLICGCHRPLSIKALFSCFHGNDAARHFRSTNISIVGDVWDCDVD